MCEIKTSFKCNCGAITVLFENGVTNSMPEELFTSHFPKEKPTHTVYNCDYCVNHWGGDLCNCGSGEKVGHCSNAYDDCINHIPAQYLEQHKNTNLWAR